MYILNMQGMSNRKDPEDWAKLDLSTPLSTALTNNKQNRRVPFMYSDKSDPKESTNHYSQVMRFDVKKDWQKVKYNFLSSNVKYLYMYIRLTILMLDYSI